MKSRQNISNKSSKSSKKGLLKDVASKLSNKVLFPEKVEEAKAYLKKIKFTTPITSVNK